MSNVFSKKNIGGVITSKIEHQDSVATMYAISLLYDNEFLNGQIPYKFDEFNISEEIEDDIEIYDKNTHIFIQVKSGGVILNEILENFYQKSIDKAIDADKYYILSSFETFADKKLIKFAENLHRYKNVLNDNMRTQIEKDEVFRNLIIECNIDKKYDKLLKFLFIDYRPLRQNDSDLIKIFRDILNYHFGKLTNEKVSTEIYYKLINEFKKLRLDYGNSISSKVLENIINSKIEFNILSPEFSGIGYKKDVISKGYIIDNEDINKLDKIHDGVYKALKSIRNNWIAYFWKEAVLSSFVGPIRCKVCGHPLMANIMGLFGLACPDCGFQPFITMIACCECGGYKVVDKQPELSKKYIENKANEFFAKNAICNNCKKELNDDVSMYRFAFVPYPLLIDGTIDKNAYARYVNEVKLQYNH